MHCYLATIGEEISEMSNGLLSSAQLEVIDMDYGKFRLSLTRKRLSKRKLLGLINSMAVINLSLKIAGKIADEKIEKTKYSVKTSARLYLNSCSLTKPHHKIPKLYCVSFI